MRAVNDGTEIPASVRMIASIIDHLERFFVESGCPLDAAQAEALQDGRRALDCQVEEVARRRSDRGSGAITALVLLAIVAAVIGTCLYMAAAADNQTILEQVENVEQSISGAFGGAW